MAPRLTWGEKNMLRVIAVLICVFAAGCNVVKPEPAPPNPTRPQVSVVDGRYLIVNQEPLVFTRSRGEVEIVWQLPKDSNLRFPDNGIVIEGRVEFACLNRNTQQGRFPYTVRVLKAGELLPPRDPEIVNEP
jgi:hypothetical protein